MGGGSPGLAGARAPKPGETRTGGRSPSRPVRWLKTDSQGTDEVADLIGSLKLALVVARSCPSATPDGPPGWLGEARRNFFGRKWRGAFEDQPRGGKLSSGQKKKQFPP